MPLLLHSPRPPQNNLLNTPNPQPQPSNSSFGRTLSTPDPTPPVGGRRRKLQLAIDAFRKQFGLQGDKTMS